MRQLVEYMRDLVLNAKGNVVSFSLKRAKRALEIESKSEGTTLKVALEVLVSLGLLQKMSKKKPQYLLQRGSPLWNALERGCIDLLTALMDEQHKKCKPPRHRQPPRRAEEGRTEKTGKSKFGLQPSNSLKCC